MLGFQALVSGVNASAEKFGGGEASLCGEGLVREGPWAILGPSLVRGKGPCRPQTLIVRAFFQKRLEAMEGV